MARTSARPMPPSPQKTMTEPPRMPATGNGAMAPRTGPSQEQIARRAYELYLARGGQHGHHEQDWLQAERELRLSLSH